LLARLLQKGLIFLADGPQGNVLSFTPPFIMTEEELDFALAVIEEAL
jgi:4-aminobutyrate aminotransferase-like enzyme